MKQSALRSTAQRSRYTISWRPCQKCEDVSLRSATRELTLGERHRAGGPTIGKIEATARSGLCDIIKSGAVRVKARWGGALVGCVILLAVGAVVLTDRCYVEEHRLLVVGGFLFWFVAFVFSPKVVRVILVVAVFGVCLFYQRSEFAPSAEAGAIATLRRLAVSAASFRQRHPTEGYPSTIPIGEPSCRARGVYEFRYNRDPSSSSGAADRFTLTATPVHGPTPRGLRSFALTEDGHIYATSPNPERPAGRTDQLLQ